MNFVRIVWLSQTIGHVLAFGFFFVKISRKIVFKVPLWVWVAWVICFVVMCTVIGVDNCSIILQRFDAYEYYYCEEHDWKPERAPQYRMWKNQIPVSDNTGQSTVCRRYMTKAAFSTCFICGTKVTFWDGTYITELVVEWIWEVPEETFRTIIWGLFVFFYSAFQTIWCAIIVTVLRSFSSCKISYLNETIIYINPAPRLLARIKNKHQTRDRDSCDFCCHF